MNKLFDTSDGFKFNLCPAGAITFHDDIIGALAATLAIIYKADDNSTVIDFNDKIPGYGSVGDVCYNADNLLKKLIATRNNLDKFLDDYNASCGTGPGDSKKFHDVAVKYDLIG